MDESQKKRVQKGKSGKGGIPTPVSPGRPKGQPNKSTIQAREAIAMFVEGNVDRLNGWLDAIAAENPKDAFDRFMSVVEYHIPKLARTEATISNPDGSNVIPDKIEIVLIPSNASKDT